jgi:carbamoylphosphate synthase small subunit
MCLSTTKPDEKKRATLILENGQRLSGFSFGSATSIGGEVGEF